jgi:hypothetical protein
MIKPKKLLVALTLPLLIVSMLTSPASADTLPDEQWTPTGPTNSDPSYGFYALGHSASFATSTSELLSFESKSYGYGDGPIKSVKSCATYPDLNCIPSQFQTYTAQLGYCGNDLKSDCVDSVEVTKVDGTKETAKFARNFPDKNNFQFKGNKSVNLPTGSSSFLVDIPSAPHIGGSTYLITATQWGNRQPTQDKFGSPNFTSSIWAVVIRSGDYQPETPSLDPANYSGLGIHTSSGSETRCTFNGGTMSSTNQCAVPVAMPTDTAFTLNMRFSIPVDSWFTGRARDVSTKVSTDSDGNQVISITGNPVKVPTLFGWVSKANAPSALIDFYKSMSPFQFDMGRPFCTGGCSNLPAWTSGDRSVANWLRSPFFDKPSMEEAALWLPILDNTAVASPTVWDMRSDNGYVDQQCSQNVGGLQGIVNTNASVYIAGPPTFNKETGTFDYKVIAPHYLPDKSVMKGTYDLLINSKLARCLYKFTSAPINATISVVSADGTNQIATAIVNEKDGFIHLGAYGFEFSEPTIQVKLTQEAPPAPKIAAKKITCIKGKVSKVVTTATCPTGYKKK